MPLTNRQLAAIHVAKKQLGLSDGEYREMLGRLTGRSSARDLDGPGFEAAMAGFKEVGFRPRFRGGSESFGNYRPGMASPAQIAMVRALWSEFTDGRGTDRTLGKWLHRTFRVSALRFVTAGVASKTIEALKSMASKKGRAEH